MTIIYFNEKKIQKRFDKNIEEAWSVKAYFS